jgi:Asp-tRNA(Asn)/Glu-tRNA(Gln) amidotransferase B subunit
MQSLLTASVACFSVHLPCRGGKTKLQGFFQGQIMKESGGRVNPSMLAAILPSMLDGQAAQ